jgi:hypothetical protein
MRSLILAGCLSVLSIHLHAEMSLKEYRTSRSSTDANAKAASKVYVQALGEGLTWANNEARDQFKLQLFCPPKGVQVDFVDLLEGKIAQLAKSDPTSSWETYYVGSTLLWSLEDTFSCDAR